MISETIFNDFEKNPCKTSTKLIFYTNVGFFHFGKL